MKRFYLYLVVLVVLSIWFGSDFKSRAQSGKFRNIEQNDEISKKEIKGVSQNLVISQFFGGGGLANAPFRNDFVELFNRGTSPVNVNGWSVQYASASGTNWLPTNLPNISIAPGQYFLIQFESNGSIGAVLPTPDLIAPLVQPEGFITNLSSTTGKIALVNSTTRLPVSTCPSSDPNIVDLVGYGSTANCFEGARTANLSVTTAGIRNGSGCDDTDSNVTDFTIGAPAPRNRNSPFGTCNLGGLLQAGGNASPNMVAPGGTTLLTVAVIRATTPPSTNITVVGNLSEISGATNQTFFDDGSNGDVTANDNVFSFLATIPTGLAGGSRNVTAIAADAQSRTANVLINITINAVFPDEDPLIFGNPSNATTDVSNENNFLLFRPQYTLSYNRSRATPNWVAWRLDSTWIGTTPRQDDFRPDTTLPNGWYQVTTTDYSGSGFDRGHMCPSGDRTRSVPDNSATFLMTNIVPQLAANNQGPWEEFESYCRTIANQGNELYIYSGVAGNVGTISQGRIVVPQFTWKVVLVLPNGGNDLQRVNKNTRTIAIIIPNQPPLNINAPWRDFRVTVDAVEGLTGYDFFSNVFVNTQNALERRRDIQ